MPLQMHKLTADEVARRFPQRQQMDLSEYVEALQDFGPGDAGSVDLDGDSPRALKRRFGVAAQRLGLALRWASETDGQTLTFQVRRTRAAAETEKTRRRRIRQAS